MSNNNNNNRETTINQLFIDMYNKLPNPNDKLIELYGTMDFMKNESLLIKYMYEYELLKPNKLHEMTCLKGCNLNDIHVIKNNLKMINNAITSHVTKSMPSTFKDMISKLLMKGGQGGSSFFDHVLPKEEQKEFINKITNGENIVLFDQAYNNFIKNNPKLVKEIRKVINIFNKENILSIVNDIINKIQSIDVFDMKKTYEVFNQFITEHHGIKNMTIKFHKSINSGLLNPSQIKKLGYQILKKMLIEMKNVGLISKDEMNQVFSIFNFQDIVNRMSGSNSDNGQSDPIDRRNRRMKNYRRKRRKELKRMYGMTHGTQINKE